MHYRTDIAIIGGGLAGLATAFELLDTGRKIILFDRDTESNLGGLAKESFGGIFLVNTREQQKSGIRDNPDLALQDWLSFAAFEDGDVWPRRWAEQYVSRCREEVYDWLRVNLKIRFFPVVHWVERGLNRPGNSVPRFHMVWGTGYELNKKMIRAVREHPGLTHLEFKFQHRVTALTGGNNKVTGFSGTDEKQNSVFTCEADHIVIASGGLSGDLSWMKDNWYKPWGSPPEILFNGSHAFSVGDLYQAAREFNAKVSHSDLHWNYAAGVHHPNPTRKDHGLSLVPPRSAIWVNYKGRRMSPPLISSFDTRALVEKICEQEKKYSWQIMNWKIAKKELAVSGSEFNDSIKNKNMAGFVLTLMLGNRKLLRALKERCSDFITAGSVEELCEKMNELDDGHPVDINELKESISRYDREVDKGKENYEDEQLIRIELLKKYRGDRIRISGNQKIMNKSAMPLVAIREYILTRKSLGGIQTDLEGKVLNSGGQPIGGLYAAGEAAGFGGGGIHGKRSLEGTFLGNCIFNGRVVARTIKG